MKKFKYGNKYKDLKGFCLVNKENGLIPYIDFKNAIIQVDFPVIVSSLEDAKKVLMNHARSGDYAIAGLEMRIIYFNERE